MVSLMWKGKCVGGFFRRINRGGSYERNQEGVQQNKYSFEIGRRTSSYREWEGTRKKSKGWIGSKPYFVGPPFTRGRALTHRAKKTELGREKRGVDHITQCRIVKVSPKSPVIDL